MNVLEIMGILFLIQISLAFILFTCLSIFSHFKFRVQKLQKQVVDKFTEDIKTGKFQLKDFTNETDENIKKCDENNNPENKVNQLESSVDQDKEKRKQEYEKALNSLKEKYSKPEEQ